MTAPVRIKVWDIAVRVLHWSLVLMFAVAYVSGDEDSLVHVYSGYGVLVVVALRILWGIVGTKYARFSEFIYGPAETMRYVRSLVSLQPLHYVGHNPIGGWMVVALLFCLLGTCWSGLEAYAEQGQGPLATHAPRVISEAMSNDDRRERSREARDRRARRDKSEVWEEIHEALSNLTLLLAMVHVAGVLVASAVHRENLIKAMVTGYKSCKDV